MPSRTVKTDTTIEKCGLCERQDINPVTVHKIWDNDIGSTLFVVTCNNCYDFVPVKLPSFDLGGQNMQKALDLWNEYQIARKAITGPIKGAPEADAAGEETR